MMREPSNTYKRFMFSFLFIPFGLTSFITYFFSARVTKRKELRNYGAIYFICAYSTLVSYFLLPKDSELVILIFILNLIIWIESLFHGFRLWNEVLHVKLPYVEIKPTLNEANDASRYLSEIIASAHSQLKELAAAMTQLPAPLNEKVALIKLKCDKIVIHVERYPEDYKHVRSFFTGYLHSIVEIVTMLSKQKMSEQELETNSALLDDLLSQFDDLSVKLDYIQDEKLSIEITQLKELMKQDEKK